MKRRACIDCLAVWSEAAWQSDGNRCPSCNTTKYVELGEEEFDASIVNDNNEPAAKGEKDAEPFGGIKGPGSGVIIPPFNYPLPPEIAEKLGDKRPTVHLITGPNGECLCGADEKTCAEVIERLFGFRNESDLATVRAESAAKDGVIDALAAEVERLTKENERLRKALMKVADQDDRQSGHDYLIHQVTMDEVKVALSTITGTK